MNLRRILPPVSQDRNTLFLYSTYATIILVLLILISASLFGCISFSHHDTTTRETMTVSDNRPECLRLLADSLRNVRHAQPLVGLFVGVSNYPETSKLWSTPAHTISAAMFREPFYITAISDTQRRDLKLITELYLDPRTDLARSTERTLSDVGGMSDVVNKYPDKKSNGKSEDVRWSYVQNAEPTTRKNLLGKLKEALRRAEEKAQTNGSVVFIFYISAHGHLGPDGRSYIFPSDTDPEDLRTWIDKQEVLSLTGRFLSRSRSDGLKRRAILVFDTCRQTNGNLPRRLSVGATRALPYAFVVQSTSPGSYAWQWTMHSGTTRNIEVISESRWGFPLPPPKAKRGLIEQRLSAKMSVMPLGSNCMISNFFSSEAKATMNASEWLLSCEKYFDEFTRDIPEMREIADRQDMQVFVPTTLENIPLLEKDSR